MANNRVVQWWGHLPETIKAAIIAGVAIIIATIMVSGFFTVVPQAAGGIYVVNKYTGSVTYCVANTCMASPLGGNK
jgi:regulator of protease activity HflC (stomatin/prohibitin superfamily)